MGRHAERRVSRVDNQSIQFKVAPLNRKYSLRHVHPSLRMLVRMNRRSSLGLVP